MPNIQDWMAKPHPLHPERSYTRDEAAHLVNQEIFGHNYTVGPDGKPVEVGKGSALQPTQQHFEALAKEAERAAMMGRHLTPEAIGAAVAAAMKGNAAITPEMIAAAVTAALGSRPKAPEPKSDKPKPGGNWTPERREAARQTMLARSAAKKTASAGA